MRILLRSSTAFALALAVASSAGARADEEGVVGGEFARGAKLYNDNCGRCHNPRSPNEFSDREWPLIVTHMRVIGGIPGDQARSIEAFLRGANNPPAPRRATRTATDEALDGEQLVERLGCRGCHVVGGTGGEVGPNLDTVFERRDESFVRAQLRDPKRNNPASVMPDLGLTEEQVDAIISTLRASH